MSVYFNQVVKNLEAHLNKELVNRAIILVILGGMVVANASASCYKDYDKFTGVTYQWCGAWGTEGKMLGGLNGLDPIPFLVTQKNGDETLYIKLVSAGDSWVFIEAGDRLVFLIDGDLIEFPITEPSKRYTDKSTKGRGNLTEEVLIESNREFFEKIAQAKNVEFALYTQEFRHERKMPNRCLGYYADLLEKAQK